MTNFTATDVKALREQTGTRMVDVRKALTKADGDAEKALEIIRLRGLESLSKREGHQASAGLLVAEVEDSISALVEVNSETDFVTENRKFIDSTDEILAAAVAPRAADLETLLATPMGRGTIQDKLNSMAAIIGEELEIHRVVHVEGEDADLYPHQTSPDLPPQVGVFVVTDTAGASAIHDIAMYVAAYIPTCLDHDHVPANVLEKGRATLVKITLEKGKPEKIVNEIVAGRLEAYFKDNCLIDQAFARDPSRSIGKVLEGVSAKITDPVRVHVGAWRFVMAPSQ